jgi:phosphatidate cytidylyltransferase
VTERTKNLAVRIVTSFLLMPVVGYLDYRGGWMFSLLLGAASAVCALEYYEITMGKWSPAAWVGIAVTFTIPFTPLIANSGQAAFYVVVGYGMFAWTYHLVRGDLKEGPLKVAYLTTGMVYGASGLTTLASLRAVEHGVWWVIVALIASWMNDTGAFFVGSAFGKHKVYPEVSPNKSWEGVFGGVGAVIVALFVFRFIFFPQLQVVDIFTIAIAAGIMGPVGDFSESMLKRSYGVKDSGKIVPGHGGILDRLDALIFNAPVTYLYVALIRPLLLGG